MLADVIECFVTPITVTRYNTEVTFVDGIEQSVTDKDTFCIQKVSVQPMTGREREVLPELIRDRELIKMYTPCKLNCVDVEGKVLADRLEYDGQDYVVQSCIDWSRHAGYYKVIAIKEND